MKLSYNLVQRWMQHWMQLNTLVVASGFISLFCFCFTISSFYSLPYFYLALDSYSWKHSPGACFLFAG